jgi:signal transduction histidine kinase
MEKELVLETSFNSERTIVTDVHVLHQIIGNLIDNACKYSHGAEDKRIWLRAREEDGCLVIEVEDRGPGVPPSERRRIFQPFRRGNTSETAGGAGLGLALARRWSRMLGAKLVLRGRRVQPGACFQLVVPIDI